MIGNFNREVQTAKPAQKESFHVQLKPGPELQRMKHQGGRANTVFAFRAVKKYERYL